ncbi:hypothetical protein ERO13_D13G184800v2 [Gossypium hirsutum]|nr:hypothetical protein ERO13_D13G184800v2 [Gossypium hirsutum]
MDCFSLLETNKEEGWFMSCLLHPCHWFPSVPPPPKVSAAAAAAAACIPRSISEIDLFMFCNTHHLCFFLFFLLICTVMACI